MPNPSFYFTLFKRFQVIGHAREGISHGRPIAPSGGFDLKDPHAVFASSNRGSLLGATTNPADSALWAVLNAKVMGNSTVTVGGASWPAMPLGNPLGWSDFQTAAPAPKLVDTFADWITAGKIDDVPDAVIATMPATLTANLDSGVSLFACSVAGDDGTRPGTVPSDYWATSLIFLVDPRTGATVTPSELAASSEYFVTAVVGNRGDAVGGRMYYQLNGLPFAPPIESAAWVMVWNSGASPAVQLPALSNLDVTSTNGAYEVFELHAGSYEVVGFRLNVQTAYDGLVAAITASGTNLGGLTAEQWVHAQGAHLCVKVLVRQQTDSWPLVSDTPFTDRRLAQKNLAPFAIDLTVSSPNPNIIWRNFMAGDVLRIAHARSAGMHRLSIETAKLHRGIRFYLAIPKASFERWVDRATLHGFEMVDAATLPGNRRLPFPDHVILANTGKENWIDVAALGKEYLAMSLGVLYDVKQLAPGALGDVSVVQRTAVPKVEEKKTAPAVEWTTVGGFTLRLSAHDARAEEKALAGSDDLAKQAAGRMEQQPQQGASIPGSTR